MSVTRITNAIPSPLFATMSPGDSTRFFILEKGSGSTSRIRIRNLVTNQNNSTPFLTVTGITSSGERGLLGLAFHPNYQSNGLFYVNVTNSSGDTEIRQYSRSSADIADPASLVVKMTIDQPFSNHNGGWIGFGPDGFLYIATGDGGSGGDPFNNSQTITNNLLGKILRIDPLGTNGPGGAYGIPASNPFVNATGDDEIWAYGIRNPWRCSFDALTGDFYIGDVGQNALEEINVQPAASSGGENYGWRIREGASGGTLAGAIDPIYDYTHGSGDLEGFSVTGGYVYRGPIVALQGSYFFADFSTSRVWSMKWDGSAASAHNGTNFIGFIDWTDILTTDVGNIGSIASFAEDADKNLYILDLGGEIYQITDAEIPVAPFAAKYLDGSLASGQLSNIYESDDVYQDLNPSPTKNLLKQIVQVIYQAEIDTATPSDVTFRVESKKIGGAVGDVILEIEMFNEITQEFELIETTVVENVDTAVTAEPGGDVTRFVHPLTKEVTTKVTWKSPTFSGTPFTWTLRVDQAVWATSQ